MLPSYIPDEKFSKEILNSLYNFFVKRIGFKNKRLMGAQHVSDLGKLIYDISVMADRFISATLPVEVVNDIREYFRNLKSVRRAVSKQSQDKTLLERGLISLLEAYKSLRNYFGGGVKGRFLAIVILALIFINETAGTGTIGTFVGLGVGHIAIKRAQYNIDNLMNSISKIRESLREAEKIRGKIGSGFEELEPRIV